MSYFDDASLVMIPSGYKDQKVYSVKPIDGSGDLTFSRASNATRVNSSGLVEKVRTNEFLYSEDLSTTHGWFASTIGLSTVNFTSNYGIAPNGTTTADRIELHLNSEPYADYVRPTASFVVGVEYTYSIYLKSLSGTPTFEFFNDGAIGVNKTITTDWARYSYTFTATSATAYPRFLVLATTSPDVDVLAWGGQIERGVMTDYIATTSAAVSVGPVSGLPRLDYSGGASCPSLLLEPQRTNAVPYSEQLSQWSLAFATLTSNDAISPDGYQNADKIVTTSAGCDVKYSNVSVSPSTTYTASFWVKLTSGNGLVGRFYDNSNGANIEYYGYDSQLTVGEWSRVTRTFITPAGCTNIQVWYLAASSSDSVTAHFWGYQVEAGAYATSYIPTLSSAVTRVADGSGTSDTFGTTYTLDADFGLYWEGVINGNTAYPVFYSGGNYALGVDYRSYYLYTSSALQLFGVGEVLTAQRTIALTAGTHYKILVKRVGSTIKWYVNGTEYANQGGTTTTTVKIRSLFGSTLGAQNHESVKQALIFETTISDANAIALTA